MTTPVSDEIVATQQCDVDVIKVLVGKSWPVAQLPLGAVLIDACDVVAHFVINQFLTGVLNAVTSQETSSVIKQIDVDVCTQPAVTPPRLARETFASFLTPRAHAHLSPLPHSHETLPNSVLYPVTRRAPT